MGFGEAIRAGFNNYANFSGRASRSEFWYWVLFVFLVGIGAGILDLAIFGSGGTPYIQTLFSLATLIPNLSVGARRLHDIGRSGWWQLLHLIFLIGTIILLIWFCQKSDPGPNRYGPNPYGGV